MALMTKMRNRMHIFLWAILILFLLSISIGGLVGGANIIDQLFGRVDPSTAIGVINGQKIIPDDFSRAVSARLEQVRTSGREINDRDFDQARTQVWDDYIREILISQSIDELEISASDQEVIYHLQNIKTFGTEDTATPIRVELDYIEKTLNNFKKMNILIDDIRLFNSNFQNYPSKDLLVDWCKKNKLSWEIEHDIFICKKI